MLTATELVFIKELIENLSEQTEEIFSSDVEMALELLNRIEPIETESVLNLLDEIEEIER